MNFLINKNKLEIGDLIIYEHNTGIIEYIDEDYEYADITYHTFNGHKVEGTVLLEDLQKV